MDFFSSTLGIIRFLEYATSDLLQRNAQESSPVTRFTELAVKAHAEPWYKDQFCQHPIFTDYVSKAMGWGVNTRSFKRTLLRNNIPGNKAIGAHYGYIFLRHGEDSVLTAWVPIGDIKLEGSGLIYLEEDK